MKVDRIGGSVEARTAGGDIDLDAIAGSVKCASAGGRIRAGSIRGDASFETGGGEIQVRDVDEHCKHAHARVERTSARRGCGSAPMG